MLHKATPDQITTNSFLADSAYRLYPSTTNLDAAVALEASEHKRKIAQLRHHFLTQLNFVVKDNAIQSTSPSSSTGFFPADSLKGTRLNCKLSEHPPSGLIFKSKSATDFTQLNLSAFRNIDPNFHIKNPSLFVSNNKAGVKSSNFLAERKSVQRGKQTTIPAFLHSADSLRASQSQQNPISNLSIKIDNNELHSLSLKTVAGDSSVHVPGCPIYTLSQCIGTTSARLISGTETSLPRPTNSTHRSTSYQFPDSELPNLDEIKVKDSEEVYRLPCRNFSPLPSQCTSAFYSSADVLQNRHFTKRKGRKMSKNHQDFCRLSADFGSVDRDPLQLGFYFEPVSTTAVKGELHSLADTKRSYRACTPWPVRHRGQPDQDLVHGLHGENRRRSISPIPYASLPVVKDPTLGNSTQPSSCRRSNRAPPDQPLTENEHGNPGNILFLTESLSANDFRQVDHSPFSSVSSKKTSPSSSSSSSICSPERSPQLLRRHERRTRSWQGRQQRHRSRPNVREQDRLLVDSLTRRIQPMLLEGRAAEVKTLLLHALAKPSTRERALRLIGYVSDALSSSWAVQIPDSPSATGVTTMGDSFSGLRLGPERPTARHSFSSDARSDRWGMGTGSTTSIHTPDFAVSASLSRGDPVGGNRNNNNNNSRYCGNNGGSYYALRLPPGGVVEPPPPPSPFSSASPPPKPFPPPSPKNAVMPSEERLRQLEARTLQLRDYNPLLITDLVTELTLDCSTDVEIVRSFFVWVTSKDFQQVDYDPAAAPDSFVGLLRNVKAGRVSVNELFHELCRFAGIPCHFISGRSKGAGYRPGMTLSENSLFRNTWLAVYVAKSWRFINCNWAARYRCVGNLPDHATYAGQQSLPPPSPAAAAAPLHSGRNNLHSLPPSPSSPSGGVGGGGGYDEFYFLTEPSEHIYEHFPDKRAWQLLAKPISEKKFISLPVLKSAFFNTKLALKKPYSAKLITKNGQVTVKLRMPKFVGISSSLENCADGSALRGLCLIEVLTQPADNVRVVCAPSQPGRYYLNVYVSSDWRRDDIRELACSFLVWTTTIAVLRFRIKKSQLFDQITAKLPCTY
uniref:KY-like immunoglobulin-like domain-containing protein n=1 Tax=Schistocephalus solidus TaxID=70667 RepID=A0A0V0J483_SCHSO